MNIPLDVRKRSFVSSGMSLNRIGQDIQLYNFNKTSLSYGMVNDIKNLLLLNKEKIANAETFELYIKKDNTNGDLDDIFTTPDGKYIRVWVLPGLHIFRFLVTPCLNFEKNDIISNCSKFSVLAPKEGYRDLHDIDKAFIDGNTNKLEIISDMDLSLVL